MNQTTKRKAPSERAVLTRTTRKNKYRKYRPISENFRGANAPSKSAPDYKCYYNSDKCLYKKIFDVGERETRDL
jgi:hypothetical protein